MNFQHCLCSCLILFGLPSSWEWSHGKASMWATEFPQYCNGSQQSPIDIVSEHAKSVGSGFPLKWMNFDKKPSKMSLSNNGHTIQLIANWDNDSDKPFITGGPAKNVEYVFFGLNFHWGPTNEVGTEHTFENRSTALESHMILLNRAYEGSFEKATEHSDGGLVVAMFYKVFNSRGSSSLQHIIDAIPAVRRLNSSTEVEIFALSDLEVVTNVKTYYSYFGSATMPTCQEVVIWILPTELFGISPEQMNIFRSIQLVDGDDHNYRPTQPVNGRVISYYE